MGGSEQIARQSWEPDEGGVFLPSVLSMYRHLHVQKHT